MNKSIVIMIFLLASCAGMSQTKKLKNLVKEIERQEFVTDSLLSSYEKKDWERTVELFERHFSEKLSYISPSVIIAASESYKNIASEMDDVGELIKKSEEVYRQGITMHGEYLMENGYKLDIYDIVDQPAEPQIGRAEFPLFLVDNYVYPSSALASGIEGTVAVQLIVTPKGELEALKVIKGIDKECDNELIRLIKESSPWKPALHRNEPVHVREIITLNYNIKRYNKRVKRKG